MSDEESFAAWMQERCEESVDDGRLLEGTLVDGYRIESLLGRGGFAEVYSAKASNGERVAIKILHRLDEQSRMRFERESHILAQIHHPNTPRLISFGSCGNRPYLVTELLHAEELPHSDRKIACLVKKVCTAVAALHKLGYAHRDIKPSNILWRDEEPVLIDYGLACPFSDGTVPPSKLSIVDGRRIIVGTAGYAAPEQFAGGKIDASTDVHALGMLINACWDGHPPRCWKSIIDRATNSRNVARYQTAVELMRSVSHRHFQNTFDRSWIIGFSLIGFLYGVLVPDVGNIVGTFFAAGFSIAALAVLKKLLRAFAERMPFRCVGWCCLLLLVSLSAFVLVIDSYVKRTPKTHGASARSQENPFTILPLDDTPLMPLNELGIDGWGMGDDMDGPVVFVQKLAYSGDFAEHREFQRHVGAVYGGETLVCEDEITNRILRVEIDHWHEGTNDLYLYRKLILDGDIVWQVTGQTQMKTKDRDCAKMKVVVDSFSAQ